MYDNRNYLIIPTTEVSKVDFSVVCETSAETLRKSVDGTKTFVKWDQAPYDPTPYEIINAETNEVETIYPQEPQPPAFIADIVGAEGPYTHAEILEILSTPEWTAPIEPIEPTPEEPVMVRARDENGRFIADDPSTPDVDEAWTVVEEV